MPDTDSNTNATDQTQAPQTQPAPPVASQPVAQPSQNGAPTAQPQNAQPQSTQPAMVSNPPASQAAPSQAQPTQPAPHPAVQHASVVRQIAETLAGGPRFKTVIATDGTRTLQRIPMDRKDIGMAIALSAITGALSGLQEKGPNANAKAAAAGFNAVAQQRQQSDQAADQQATQDFSRRAAVAEANMRMLNNAIQVGRLQREDHDAMVNAYADQLQDLKDNSPEVIKSTGLSEAEAKDMQKYPLADYLRIPDGTVPRLGSDGQQIKDSSGAPMWDNTYTLVDKNAKTSLTDADGKPQQWVQDAISWGLPGYPASLTKAPAGFQVSAAAAGRAQHQVVMLNALQSELNSFTNSFGKDKSGKPVLDPIDLKAELQKDPSLLNAVQHFQRAAGSSTQPDRQIDALRSDPKTAPYAARIISLFGADNLEKFKSDRESREAAEKTAAQTQARLQTEAALGPMTDDKAASILSDPNATTAQKTRASSFQTIKAQQKAIQKQNELKADQAVKQGSPEAAGKLLYDGTLTLSELKARGTTPEFITATTNAALALARANGETNWTPQVGEAQFNAAKSSQNVQFFGSANSLLDKGGTLDQLAAQHAKLGNGSIPLFNKWKDYAEYQAGDPALSGFMQTAVGVADDYAKVMGGGTGSDTSRLQVMQSFANAHNPQQMAAAIDAARNAVKSQVSSRIGRNRVMQQMYGQNVPQQSTPPAGATMKVPGSDGKLHWSDGKQDLGVVQ